MNIVKQTKLISLAEIRNFCAFSFVLSFALTCWLLAKLANLPHLPNSPQTYSPNLPFSSNSPYLPLAKRPLLSCYLHWNKLSKSPSRQCKALLAILTISPTSLLRVHISGRKWNRGEEARLAHDESRASDIKELSHWRREQQRQHYKIQIWLIEWRKIISVLHVQPGGRERLYCFPLFAHYRLITTSVTSHSNEAKLRLAWLV